MNRAVMTSVASAIVVVAAALAVSSCMTVRRADPHGPDPRASLPPLPAAKAATPTIQTVLLVAPLLVFAGQVLGQPMDLAFTSFEVVSIVLATVITRELIQDGRANWFEGVLLVAAYAILAIGFFHLPE